MELNDIQKLMQTFNDTGLSRLQYNNGVESLVLEKGVQVSHAIPVHAAPEVFQQPISAPHHYNEMSRPVAPEVIEKSRPVLEDTIKAPMVGVFYLAPSPEASPYVVKGQSVAKGQTLCILEAMKVLNEIQAEWDGIVEAILVQPEDIVEYGQPLFQIRRV